MSDQPAPGRLPPPMWRSSSLRTAVLAALVVWGPGVVLLSLHHREWTHHVLDEASGEVEGLFEELEEIVREHRFGSLGEPLEGLDELGAVSSKDFQQRYLEKVEKELEFRPDDYGLKLRLVVLRETRDQILADAPLDALVELMEEEVPEEFHDLIEDLIDDFLEHYFDAQEDQEESLEISAQEVVDSVGGSEVLEEAWACLWLGDASAQLLLSNFDEMVHTFVAGRFTVASLSGATPGEDSGEVLEPACLIDERILDDGSKLLIGPRIDKRYQQIRQSARRRDLLLLLGLPLALVVGWLQSRSTTRFLSALGSAAQRQERGEVTARLQIAPDGRDLTFAVDTINRMLARLEQTMQGLSRVSDSIAHDLRTPLSRLQGQLDLLKQSSDPSGELIEAVQDEADQLLQTFNALLRIAQVESGSKKQGFRDLDLAGIVHDVAELYAPVFAEKNIDFTVGVPRHRVAYRGDRDQWLQALSNLVENALKYTPEGGRVDFQLEDRGGRPRIRLADSGPGIPESERENVFRRFYRLQRHRGERGSGLGLSLVGAVCDLHGAEIRLGGDRGLIVDIEL